jgi:peptidoglycan hydrolase-like protein with peptidoglycan-binding domain
MSSRHHFKYVWLLIPGFLAGLLLATYEEARAGSRGNAAAAGAAGLAIGLIIGGMAAEQQKQQQQQALPNCRSLHGPGAVNATSNPQRCACRSGYTRVSEGGAWRCTPSDSNTAGATRSIGGADRYENEKIQEALNLLGYDAGVVDGAPGEKTRQAVRRFQADRGFTQTGQLAAAEKQILFKTVEERRTALGDTRGGSGVPPTPPALPPTSPSADTGISASDPRMELALWETVKDSKSRVELEEYVARYPGGQFTKVALRRIEQITRDEVDKRPPVELRKDGASDFPAVDDANYPRARQRRSDAVAVIIGNSTYRGTPNVEYAARDAEAMKLLAVKTLGLESDNIVFIKDATKTDFDGVFGSEKDHKGRLWRLLDPDGRSDLYVFYSGHGVPGGKENDSHFLLPVDGDPNHASLTAYPVKQLLENLGKLATKSTTVFLDACFSGQSPDPAGAPLIKHASPVFVTKALPSDPTRINMFAAAGERELSSWDTETGHGIFTRFVISGLTGQADEDRNSEITAKELNDYLVRQVRKTARRMHGREQEPRFSGPNPGFVLASYAF